MSNNKEHLKVVMVGHVDHGKSTILGRLLADTGSLPEGKLEQIQESCRRNAKPFEYAFLLDALKAEQSQGITIDMARCFFHTRKRNYIMIDAPGHIEFLKNMVTGAARAAAALLVIDAHEGIQENSKRHGYMLSMLGVNQVAVLINKFDLVRHSREVYTQIVTDYTAFLENIGVKALNYIPVSGRDGLNIASLDKEVTGWYSGPSVLEQLDLFKLPPPRTDRPFRMPVQDVYKFTQMNDERRIIAGTIESGTVSSGDKVVFLPSGKESAVKSIEGFNVLESQTTQAPHTAGFTLTTQIYVRPGELMCRADEVQAGVGSRFRVNLFWLARTPMIKGRQYKFKLGASRVMAELVEVVNVLDASELTSVAHKQQLDRHDIGECIVETVKPLAYDLVHDIEGTGRFVIVDNYEIAGGGVIVEKLGDGQLLVEEHIRKREISWEHGLISENERTARNHHRGKFVLFSGPEDVKREIAKQLEAELFNMQLHAYYLGVGAVLEGLDSDLTVDPQAREEHIRRLGELARILTDAGTIFITAVEDLDDYELERLKLLNSPYEFIVVNVGENRFTHYHADLYLFGNEPVAAGVSRVLQLLNQQQIIPDYCI